MRTPAGTECRFYYEDNYRARVHQECRLIARNPHSERWTPDLCGRCPVPGILRANACSDLVLEGRVVRRFGLFSRVEVTAFCARHLVDVPEPMVGCGQCIQQAAVLEGS